MLVGMLHVPVNTILASPPAHCDALGLPAAAPRDWELLEKLDPLPPFPGLALSEDDMGAGSQRVRALSFFPFIEDRMLAEAAVYVRHGFPALMLENVAGPYFVRGEQPPVIFWVMQALAERLRVAYPEARIGLQVLAFSDDWAMDIACRCGLDFIRCESVLFEGVRPEGRTPNRGNLAKLYIARQQFLARQGSKSAGPQVYADLQKKHTVFPAELEPLEPWLDNILFQKLEGVIVTGKATGSEVAEEDLRWTREAIDKVKAYTAKTLGRAWSPPLLVGSGVTIENLPLCARYADGLIVGSSLKRGGYWECPLDEERVKSFAGVWNRPL